MPTQTIPTSQDDRILDYLSGNITVDDAGVMKVEGVLGPKRYLIAVLDRPRKLRAQARRFLIRIIRPDGTLDRERVFNSEASAVVLLAAIQEGKDIKLPPRGAALRNAPPKPTGRRVLRVAHKN